MKYIAYMYEIHKESFQNIMFQKKNAECFVLVCKGSISFFLVKFRDRHCKITWTAEITDCSGVTCSPSQELTSGSINIQET